MKIPNIILILFLTASEGFGQSILKDYYQGNKDSLIKDATQLIYLPEPTFIQTDRPIEPNSEATADIGFEQVYKSEARYFTVRDSKRIFAYRFPNPSENTIVLIHGAGSSGYLYNKTAGLLQEATQAEIYTIDLRGHGQSDGKSGDVDYINQYVDDLEDIMKEIRREKPNGKIIIAGHSMGGGITLRYAMGKQNEQPDGFLLFAPLIGHNSPAFKQGQSNEQAEPYMKIHYERIIGLKMLNEINNHKYDSLPVLFFDLPETVPLRKYGYRANTSMAPDDYVEGLKSVNKPMLILIGSNDEAFSAEALQKAILQNSSGEVHIIDNATHNGIRHNAQSFNFIKDWFLRL